MLPAVPRHEQDASASVVNALTGRTYKNHAVFSSFAPVQVTLRDQRADEFVDFLGVHYPRPLHCNRAYMQQPRAYASRTRPCELNARLRDNATVSAAPLQTAWPVISEEYFEYVDVLSAVHHYVTTQAGRGQSGERPFTFIELGCGYGHWTWAALAALRSRLAPDKELPPTHFLCVDVVGALGPTLDDMAARNAYRRDAKHALDFHVGFVTSSAQLSERQQQWGQVNVKAYTRDWGLSNRSRAARDASAAPLQPTSLRELIRAYKLPCPIDMLDVDIQGGEYQLFDDNATLKLLRARVLRVHVGVHDWRPSSNAPLLAQFSDDDWHRAWFYPKGAHPTAWGPVSFADGVLGLTNRHVPRCERSYEVGVRS